LLEFTPDRESDEETQLYTPPTQPTQKFLVDEPEEEFEGDEEPKDEQEDKEEENEPKQEEEDANEPEQEEELEFFDLPATVQLTPPIRSPKGKEKEEDDEDEEPPVGACLRGRRLKSVHTPTPKPIDLRSSSTASSSRSTQRTPSKPIRIEDSDSDYNYPQDNSGMTSGEDSELSQDDSDVAKEDNEIASQLVGKKPRYLSLSTSQPWEELVHCPPVWSEETMKKHQWVGSIYDYFYQQLVSEEQKSVMLQWPLHPEVIITFVK